MTVWDYIHLISWASDRYGDKLVQLLTRYNKQGLQEINLEEAKEFYETEILKKEDSNNADMPDMRSDD